MAIYALGIVHLLNILIGLDFGARMVAFTDNLTGVETLEQLKL